MSGAVAGELWEAPLCDVGERSSADRASSSSETAPQEDDSMYRLRLARRAAASDASEPWRADRLLGYISLFMWGGTLVKVAPLLPPSGNVQAVAGFVAIFALVVAWPTWRLGSYQRWRVPILAFLRLFLVALPFNFRTDVFDAIAPHVHTGRLALVSNAFQLFMAIRVALLTFTCLGWRVPFRLHLLLHTANVAMLARFGLSNYLQGKLLKSDELGAAAAAVHRCMSYATMLFVPRVTVAAPEGDYAQRAAFVIFCWAILGWLLPTLLLLPESAQQEQQWRRQRRPRSLAARLALLALDRFAGGLERWLRMLQLRTHAQQQHDQERQRREAEAPGAAAAGDPNEEPEHLSYAASYMLCWWLALLVAWSAACAAASQLPPPPPPPPP